MVKRHHEVHNLPRVGTTIQKIPDLNKRCLPTSPMVFLIRQVGTLEDRNEIVKVTMNVGNRHNSIRSVRWKLCWLSPHQSHSHQDRQQRSTHVAGKRIGHESNDLPSSSCSQSPLGFREIVEIP